jgi:hypothetical protein
VSTQAERTLFRPLRTRARIAGHVLWDYVNRPVADAISEVPWCADAVSPQWLSEVLCRDRPGAQVVSVEVTPVSSGSSVRSRIRATYNEAGARAGLPERLFSKATPTILTRLSSAMAAAKEGGFFREIRPALTIEAPIHYFSGFDRESGRSFHLFEDLVATRQARFCNDKTPISREQAEQIVDLLAAVHAPFHDSPRLAGDLRWLPPFEAFLRTGERDGIVVGHDQAMITAAHVIPADVTARKHEIWPMTLAGLRAHEEGPRTLLHSDVHLGNWYVTGEGRMGLCDWALVCVGHWSRDLAYAISTTLEIEDRRAWERDLIGRYIDRMRQIGGVAIAFDDAWRRYRQQMFAALLMWTPTLCHPPTMPDMQPEVMSLQMIRRITAAISDLDSFDSQETAA